jgi:hypothetical protein
MDRRELLRRLCVLARRGSAGNIDDALASAALEEQVAPLLGARLHAGGLTASGRTQALLVGAHLAEVARAQQRGAVLAHLARTFAAVGVAFVTLKGSALERTIYRPGERAMADLDVLVAAEQLAAASTALAAAGATERQHRVLLTQLGLGHERTFEWQGHTIDLHVRVASWPLWRVRNDELLRFATPAADGIPVPSLDDLLVTLALHAAQDGYVLAGRHLVDAFLLADEPRIDPLDVAAIAHAWGAARAVTTFVHLGLELGAAGERWQGALRSLDPGGATEGQARALPLLRPRARKGLELAARAELLRTHDHALRPVIYLAVRCLLRAGDRLLGRH